MYCYDIYYVYSYTMFCAKYQINFLLENITLSVQQKPFGGPCDNILIFLMHTKISSQAPHFESSGLPTLFRPLPVNIESPLSYRPEFYRYIRACGQYLFRYVILVGTITEDIDREFTEHLAVQISTCSFNQNLGCLTVLSVMAHWPLLVKFVLRLSG